MNRIRRRLTLGMLLVGMVGSAAASSDEPTPPPLPETAAIALVWSGPPTLLAHQPVTYTLTAHNVSKQPAGNVVVQVRVPTSTTVATTKPVAERRNRVFLWDVGTLESGKEIAFQLTLQASNCCELGCEAWVSYTGSSAMTVVVRDPKLNVTIDAPKTVILGETIPLSYRVRNNGNCALENVSAKYQNKTLTIETMKPNAERTLSFHLPAGKGGLQTYTIEAVGNDNVTAQAKTTVRVLVPKLSLTAQGPSKRLVGMKADYTATVTNSGEVPLTDVIVQCSRPKGLKGNKAVVRLDRLAVGESRTIDFPSMVEDAGSLKPSFVAKASHDTTASDSALTVVEGIPAIRIELIDLQDPIRVGDKTTYEIRITNTGSASDSQLTLACQLPKQMTFVSAKGPVRYSHDADNRVIFEPIMTLAPQTEARFLVTVKTTAPGDTRFQAVVKSAHLNTPVNNEESTRIYGE